MTTTKKLSTIAAIAATVSLSLAAAGPASAKGGNATIARGTCTNGSTWKLKGKPDNGRLELEFEVDTNKVGEVWAVTIKDNATTVFSGNRATLAPSGSFSVEKLTANQAGADKIVAVATRNGNTCRGSITL